MSELLKQLRAIWAFSKREMVIWTSYKVNIWTWIIDVFVNTSIFFLVSLLVGHHSMGAYGTNYISFVVIGLSVYYISYTNLGDPFPRVARIYWNGTMDLYMLSPLSYFTPIIGVMFRSVIDDYPRVGLAFLFGWLFFSATFTFRAPLYVIAGVIFIGLSTFGIGMISASSFYLLNFKRGSEPISFILQDVIIALVGGYYYPVSVLPNYLQILASFIPHTYALDLFRRALLKGASLTTPVLPLQHLLNLSPLAVDTFALAVLTAIFFPSGFYLYYLGIQKARREGTLTRWQ